MPQIDRNVAVVEFEVVNVVEDAEEWIHCWSWIHTEQIVVDAKRPDQQSTASRSHRLCIFDDDGRRCDVEVVSDA